MYEQVYRPMYVHVYGNVTTHAYRPVYGHVHRPMYVHVCGHVYRLVDERVYGNVYAHVTDTRICEVATFAYWAFGLVSHVDACTHVHILAWLCARLCTCSGGSCKASMSARPDSSPARRHVYCAGIGRAGRQDGRLGESFPTVRSPCRTLVHMHARTGRARRR